MHYEVIKQIIQAKINHENKETIFGDIRLFHERYSVFRELLNKSAESHL